MVKHTLRQQENALLSSVSDGMVQMRYIGSGRRKLVFLSCKLLEKLARDASPSFLFVNGDAFLRGITLAMTRNNSEDNSQ